MSVPNNVSGQFLASPAIPSGTDENMSNSLRKTVDAFGLLPNVEALVFDTTASNTGVWRGATSRFEKSLGRSVL